MDLEVHQEKKPEIKSREANFHNQIKLLAQQQEETFSVISVLFSEFLPSLTNRRKDMSKQKRHFERARTSHAEGWRFEIFF